MKIYKITEASEYLGVSIQKAIRKACAIVSMVYRAIGDFANSSDCFCEKNKDRYESYRNDGKALEYVRQAVEKQLREDGYEPKWVD